MIDLNRKYSKCGYDDETGDFEHQDVYGLDDCLASIKTRMTDLHEQNKRLKKQLKEIEDEKWADNKLQEMKRALDRMNREYYQQGFPISDANQRKIDKWLQNHAHVGGAIGGVHEYIFIPTSIGTVGKVRCPDCNETLVFDEF